MTIAKTAAKVHLANLNTQLDALIRKMFKVLADAPEANALNVEYDVLLALEAAAGQQGGARPLAYIPP